MADVIELRKDFNVAVRDSVKLDPFFIQTDQPQGDTNSLRSWHILWFLHIGGFFAFLVMGVVLMVAGWL